MAYRKKLIEVALPLDAINRESAREKSIRHGHPSTLHLWWARRPLASCRAVIFASLVDDPDEPNAPKPYLEALDKLEKPPTGADSRRDKLFYFIERLVKWESTTDEVILGKARELINLACEGNPPPLLDPFCGGGSIPLEGQRLGLEVYASDLNPVAVLITKALVEIPPKFAGQPPVNPDDRAKLGAGAAWKGAAGLAADVRYYGKWMRDRAWERIGHLYPKGPNGETVIAWLWARTVECPNPACRAKMPLVRSFWLSTKKGKEAWVKPVADPAAKGVVFEVRTGAPEDPTSVNQGSKIARGANFFCLTCGQASEDQYIKDEGIARRLGVQPLAIVAEGIRSRAYLSPSAMPSIPIDVRSNIQGLQAEIADDPRNIWCKQYGLTTFADLFTTRQLVALTSFSDLVGEARQLAVAHGRDAGLGNDSVGLESGGIGLSAYADAIATYLAMSVSKAADLASAICHWQPNPEHLKIAPTFSRHALPMSWDFAEGNPFSDSSGNFYRQIELITDVLYRLPTSGTPTVTQLDATTAMSNVQSPVIATDPPYYDNIGYADLSDFFYVWLRRSLGEIHRSLFSTILTPKTQELIASPYRFEGSKTKAEQHFEHGLRQVFASVRVRSTQEFPMTLYYAFKQTDASGTGSSPGWHTMLSGLYEEGLQVVGTWPVRTERLVRSNSIGANALASSILIACRPCSEHVETTFRVLQRELSEEMPSALSVMTGRDRGTSEPWVDPIDLRQAAIGPGMSVFTRYARVQKADGDPLTVPEALQEINESVDRYFEEAEGSLDPASRFCVYWYREYGFTTGPYGRAQTLGNANGTTPETLEMRGLLNADRGNVTLLKPAQYRETMQAGPSVWELCHRLVLALQDEGEDAAATLYNRMPGLAEEARDLAYRLYLEAEKKSRAEDALGYNALVASWTEIRKQAAASKAASQATLGV